MAQELIARFLKLIIELITRLTVIDVASLMVLFYNCPLVDL